MPAPDHEGTSDKPSLRDTNSSGVTPPEKRSSLGTKNENASPSEHASERDETNACGPRPTDDEANHATSECDKTARDEDDRDEDERDEDERDLSDNDGSTRDGTECDEAERAEPKRNESKRDKSERDETGNPSGADDPPFKAPRDAPQEA